MTDIIYLDYFWLMINIKIASTSPGDDWKEESEA